MDCFQLFVEEMKYDDTPELILVAVFQLSGLPHFKDPKHLTTEVWSFLYDVEVGGSAWLPALGAASQRVWESLKSLGSVNTKANRT